MRALIQRVSGAKVEIDQEIHAQIGPGLLVFLGVTHGDTEADAVYLAGKVSRLRIFSDENGKMNRSLTDFAGEVLVVSQFTLYGDVRKGNRPGFDQAAAPQQAELLYNQFVSQLKRLGLPVKTGRFAAHMRVSLLNDGPVTLMLESPPPK
ncbi:MAG: D-aminoacyl-tRNA deacylase [Saccharofermentanales bacterium]|jgi:D-tyrosyl-tRNA(Tyr) deacylase|nr:D-tyrosyl-tRNA(Tyr) deacylase [Clostridiaceae bacterium]